MDAQHVLSASLLDIIFEGRNKDYGAYVLRNEYNKRLVIAMSATGILTMLLAIIYLSQNDSGTHLARAIPIPDIELSRIEKKEEIPPLKPVQPRPPVQKITSTVRNTVPIIVTNPPKEEMPPDNTSLEQARIGTITQEGLPEDATAPPLGTSDGVTGIKDDSASEENASFTPVEIESAFPGGVAAWQRFLNKTLRYPHEAQENQIQGPVVVQFIVDAVGDVSEVEAISGPSELRGEAERVIRKSGKWSPAVQNGRKVKSYKKQPIIFRLSNDF